ncbi:hypothetical protein IJ818_08375 [bacterium]|nr:hypothetical protein [bacterium]
MKHFIFAIITGLLFCQPVSAATVQQNQNSKSTLTCDSAVNLKKPMVVLYSADYCYYCKKFKPVFYHLSYNLSDEYNFIVYDITKKHKQTICDNVDLDGIPTLYVFNPKTGSKYLVPERYYSNPGMLKNKLVEYYKNLK